MLIDAHRSRRLADNNGDGIGLLGNGRRSAMAAAQPLGYYQGLGIDFQMQTRGHRDCVPADKDRTVELGNFFDLLAYLALVQVALFIAVTAKGIEIDRLRFAEHFAVIAD